VVLTRCDAVEPSAIEKLIAEVRGIAPGIEIAQTIHAPLELLNGVEPADVAILRGKPVAAFCGIGNPEAFRQTLVSLGADVREFRAFADHHAYSREDVEELNRWAATMPADACVATTQKDWVKIRLADVGGRPLWAVRVGLQFRSGKEEFDRVVLEVASQ
jgi:tetraacyldisaccharide 4'-kinase